MILALDLDSDGPSVSTDSSSKVRSNIITTGPSHVDPLPDLVLDDDHSYPMNMNSHSNRRTFHPSDMMSYHHPAMGLGPVSTFAAPPAGPLPVPLPVPSSHRDDVDAPGELVPHPDDWNRLDTFQTRLEGLQYTLDRTMSKWARDQDPNQEVSHHEGLGM